MWINDLLLAFEILEKYYIPISINMKYQKYSFQHENVLFYIIWKKINCNVKWLETKNWGCVCIVHLIICWLPYYSLIFFFSHHNLPLYRTYVYKGADKPPLAFKARKKGTLKWEKMATSFTHSLFFFFLSLFIMFFFLLYFVGKVIGLFWKRPRG